MNGDLRVERSIGELRVERSTGELKVGSIVEENSR